MRYSSRSVGLAAQLRWVFSSLVLAGSVVVGQVALAQGTQVQLEVVDEGGETYIPEAVLVRAGEGAWQPVELPVVDETTFPEAFDLIEQRLARPDAPLTFTLPEGETRYSLALTCEPAGRVGLLGHTFRLYALTTEVTALRVACPAMAETPSATVGGRIGYGGRTDLLFEVQSRQDTTVVRDASGGYSAAVDPDAQDLVVLVYEQGDLPGFYGALVAGQVRHDVEVAGEYTDLDLLLDESVAIGERVALAEPDAPEGYETLALTALVSRDGAAPYISVAEPDYPLIAGAAEGDRYLGEALAASPDEQNVLTHVKLVGAPEPFDFTLPAPWPPYSLGPAPLPVFRDLTHLRDDAELRAYQMDLNGVIQDTRVVVSPAFLGEETAYTLPDLGEFEGFERYTPTGSVDWQLTALLADTSLQALLATPTVAVGEAPGLMDPDERLYLPDLPALDMRTSVVTGELFVR